MLFLDLFLFLSNYKLSISLLWILCKICVRIINGEHCVKSVVGGVSVTMQEYGLNAKIVVAEAFVYMADKNPDVKTVAAKASVYTVDENQSAKSVGV